MTHYDIKRLALTLSVQAEIEGMKVANKSRISNDYAPMYSEDDFQDKANLLETYGTYNDEQLFER